MLTLPPKPTRRKVQALAETSVMSGAVCQLVTLREYSFTFSDQIQSRPASMVVLSVWFGASVAADAVFTGPRAERQAQMILSVTEGYPHSYQRGRVLIGLIGPLARTTLLRT
jgi:hypothetical protein